MAELLQSQTQPVALVPQVRASAASGVVYDANGSAKASLAGTLDTVDTTVASLGATSDVFTLTSATGVVAGRDYWYTSVDGWACKVRVSSVDGAVVTLEAPPLSAPQVGDTFKGLRFTASVPGSALGTRGRTRIDWSLTVGGEAESARQFFWVVVSKFRAPATPDDASRIAYELFGPWAKTQKPATWIRIAAEASDRVYEELTAHQDYPSLLAAHDAFARAGDIAVRLVLAAKGRVPPGYDAAAYITEQEDKLEGAVRKAVAGNPVDRNDDGAITTDEVVGLRNTIIERV